jgi:hypothetical protein
MIAPTGAVNMLYRILSTWISSPCVTITEALVGTHGWVVQCDSFSLAFVGEKTIKATFTTINVTQK